MGQRIGYSFLVIILLVVAVILGQDAGAFPALSAQAATTTITPEYVLTLVGQIIAPLGLLFVTLQRLFSAVTSRVIDGTLKPGSFVELLKTREFVLATVSVIVGLFQIFSPTFLMSPEQQAVLTNGIMLVINSLLGSLGERGSGSPDVTYVELP